MTLTMRNDIATVALNALTAKTETTLEWPENDDKMILVVQNTSSSDTDLKILAGNGIQGIASHTVAVPKSSVNLIKLESGRFKNVSGANKGKIVVVSNGTPSVGIAALV